ncbi:MAG: hypothetical protein ACHQNE_01690 [Candidatus Kapaibacterium sp.]
METDRNNVQELAKSQHAVIDKMRERRNLILELSTTFDILSGDFQRLLDLTREQSTKNNEDGVWFFSRSAIRAGFALFEFSTYMFFHITLMSDASNVTSPPFDKEKVESFTSGNWRKFRMSTFDTFKFAVESIKAAYSISYQPDFGRHEWGRFKEAIAKRDGFMHPKKSTDVLLGAVEYDKIGEGMQWIVNEITRFFDEVLASLNNSSN